jgi:hypothetical protein
MATGSAVLVLIGAPSRRPTAQAVIDGLARVGLRLRRIERAGVDARGSTPYFADGEDGERLFVKTLGEDERSADLLFRLYRWMQPRAFGDERPFSTLRRGVEHEALVALAAQDLGIRTPRLRAFATADPNGYVLAYEAIAGKSLDRLDPEEVTDGVLDAIWGLLGELHRHGIATGTSAWPTSSSLTTARCGSSTSASASSPLPTCSSQPTSRSSSPLPACMSAPLEPSPTRHPLSTGPRCRRHSSACAHGR